MTDILFQDKNVYIQRECDFKKSGYYQKYIKYKKKYIDLKNQLSFSQDARIKEKYIDLKNQLSFLQDTRIKKKYIDLKKDMLGGGFSIFLRFDKIYEVTVNPEDTIENVIILFIKASGIDGEFKIIYKGKELESQRTVTDYNIVKDETLIINNKIRRQRTVQNIYLLEYLFNKLKTEYAEGQQIMISTMSANQKTHRGGELDISQQIKFHRINPDAREIIIILYDSSFFIPEAEQDQLYSLVDLIQQPLEDLPKAIDSKLIRKYIKPRDTLFVINETNPNKDIYREYFTIYNSDHHRINKKITWYIMNYFSSSDLNEFKYLIDKYTMTDKIELLGYNE